MPTKTKPSKTARIHKLYNHNVYYMFSQKPKGLGEMHEDLRAIWLNICNPTNQQSCFINLGILGRISFHPQCSSVFLIHIPLREAGPPH